MSADNLEDAVALLGAIASKKLAENLTDPVLMRELHKGNVVNLAVPLHLSDGTHGILTITFELDK